MKTARIDEDCTLDSMRREQPSASFAAELLPCRSFRAPANVPRFA